MNSPATFQQSGEAGLPIFVATRLGDLNELVPNLRVYREAWAAAGHPGTDHGKLNKKWRGRLQQ